jgi:hypothetical protein
MMIATILLIFDLLFLLIRGTALFSFWYFLWIYPIEIFIYIVIGCILAFLLSKYNIQM